MNPFKRPDLNRLLLILFVIFLSGIACKEQKNQEKESIVSIDSDNLTTDKNSPDYIALEQERYGKGGLTIEDMYLWDDSILIETGDDFYIFSEDSEYLSRLQIKGIGKILDVVMHKGMAYAVGIDEKGYELKYKKNNKWISHKLPDELENSFEVSPVTLLSDLETLVVMNKSNIYKFADSKWSKIQIPKIDFEIGAYSSERLSLFGRSTHIQLLNNTVFVGWDFGEWGGGLMELDISNDPAKWKKTEINNNINGIVKDNSRNIWCGVGLGHLGGRSAGLFKYISGKWENIFYQDNFNEKENNKFFGDDSSLESIFVTKNNEILLLAGDLGIFKYINGEVKKVINWKEKIFLPYRALSINDKLYLATRGGAVVVFDGTKFISTSYLETKETKYYEKINTAIREGDFNKLQNILNETNSEYNWETNLISSALMSKQFKIAQYLIRNNNIIHRYSDRIDLSSMDMATLKTLLKKGYKIKLSDIGPKFYDKNVKKYLLENVKIIDKEDFRIKHEFRYENDIELLSFYLKNGYSLKNDSHHGETFLHFTAASGSLEKVAFLIKNGADINARTDDRFNNGATPLIIATKLGNLEMVKLLVKKGAYVTLPDATGNTAIFYARKKEEAQEIFNPGIYYTIKIVQNYQGIEEFLTKSERNITEKEKTAVSKLIDKYRLEPKHAQLLDAIKNKNIPMINQLLSSEFDITVLDKREYSILMSALLPELYKIEDRRVIRTSGNQCNYDFEIFKILIDRSVETTGKIFDEQNLLKYTVNCGDIDGIEYLIKKGADINFKDEYGWTLLNSLLARNYNDQKKCLIAKFLIMNGADVNSIDGRESTPLDYVKNECKDPGLYELIISKGGKTGKELKAAMKTQKK